MQQIKTFSKSDVLGIINSSLCIVHCIATPVLIGLGAHYLESPLFSYLFVAIAFASIFIAAKKTTSKKIKTALWISFIGLAISLLLENKWEGFEYTGYLFSASTIITHIRNIKYCRKCNEK